jgi:hypothetical protein
MPIPTITIEGTNKIREEEAPEEIEAGTEAETEATLKTSVHPIGYPVAYRPTNAFGV